MGKKSNPISQSSPNNVDNIDTSSAGYAHASSINIETYFQFPIFLTPTDQIKRKEQWFNNRIQALKDTFEQQIQSQMTMHTDALQRQENNLLAIIADVEKNYNDAMKQLKMEWNNNINKKLKTRFVTMLILLRRLMTSLNKINNIWLMLLLRR